MTLQDEMIGKHPSNGFFYDWIEYDDTECTAKKRHRYLCEKDEKKQEAIIEVANWLLTYHLSDSKRMVLSKKKKILQKYDFKEYANSLEIFPNADKTKKGNLGEVILTEYLSKISGIDILVYKLRFNTNVDQSMKGDDVLLVDEKRIILGESKFRSSPSKDAVEEASLQMDKKLKLPMSLGFIAEKLFMQGNFELSEKIIDIQHNMSKNSLDIKNVGFLLSTKLVKNYVERNMSSDNDDFIFISLGINNPKEFMELAFKQAKELLMEVALDES